MQPCIPACTAAASTPRPMAVAAPTALPRTASSAAMGEQKAMPMIIMPPDQGDEASMTCPTPAAVPARKPVPV